VPVLAPFFSARRGRDPFFKFFMKTIFPRQVREYEEKFGIRFVGWYNVAHGWDFDNVIRLDLGLEYQPVIDERVTAAAASPNPSPFPPEQSYSNLNQRISVLLDSGKPLVISQAADPGSTRQISVEVKATIAK